MIAADVAKRQRELDALSADLIAQSERLRRMPQGGGLFYDLGGVIFPETTYLVSVNAVNGNTSILQANDRFSTYNVVWGELVEDILPLLEQPENLPRGREVVIQN